MNAFHRLDIKALRLSRQLRLREAMAKLPRLDSHGLPELPAALKSMVERLGALTDAAADLPLPLRQPAPAAARQGGRFEDRAYDGEGGKRSYKLFIPDGHAGAALPLLVMLHGCTQSPDDFAAGTRMNSLAAEGGFLVAYPAQARGANMQKCWNWFNAENQRPGEGEAALIAGITRAVMAECAVRPGQVFIAGMSAGGAQAANMGIAYPELFAAVGVHSGLGCGAAHDVGSAMAAMAVGAPALPAAARPVPTIVFHGDHDRTVNQDNAARVIEQARAGVKLRRQVSEGEAGGVRYTRVVEATEAGRPMLENWTLHGAGHNWSGGDPTGSFTDAHGPDASREMLRFFKAQA